MVAHKGLYRISEVAEIVGKSRRQIYRYIESGELRAVRKFGVLFVPMDEIVDFVPDEKSVTYCDMKQ